MRMYVKLSEQDPPEYDSITSMLIALQGAHFSIVNTSMGEMLNEAQQAELFDAFNHVKSVLEPLRHLDPYEFDDNSGEMAPSQHPPVKPTRAILTASVRDDQPVARIVLLDTPKPGEERQIDLEPAAGLDLAVQLLHFVRQVGFKPAEDGGLDVYRS